MLTVLSVLTWQKVLFGAVPEWVDFEGQEQAEMTLGFLKLGISM